MPLFWFVLFLINSAVVLLDDVVWHSFWAWPLASSFLAGISIVMCRREFVKRER